MGKLTDLQLREWVKRGERFEGRADGDGLYLRYRENDKSPVWRFRYRLAGKSRVMQIGTYPAMSLAQARRTVRELAARVTLGFDVAGEKQERKAEAAEKLAQAQNALTFAGLAEEFCERMIKPRWEHPGFVTGIINRSILPYIGHMRPEDIETRDVDNILRKLTADGKRVTANKVLQFTRRIFEYGIRRQMLEHNPAQRLTVADAGGFMRGRTRWLTREEITRLFQEMSAAKRFSRDNALAIRLLLALCCRKMELVSAPWEEFDLDGGVWYLGRAKRFNVEKGRLEPWNPKNGEKLDIPLPAPAVTWLTELKERAGGSPWLFPARKKRHRGLPHMEASTLDAALAKLRKAMPDVPHFTIHDLRRTGRTHLAALGVDPVIAERCLNHRIGGVEGIYDQHTYFDERRAGLTKWADWLEALEKEANQ
ncbi:TPA: tyrosine-type recombinase/integrase [Salmonella enterica subsp. diarizonae serovar 61:r:-]